MGPKQVIQLASKHTEYWSINHTSAELCLTDAIQLYKQGNKKDAKKRALDSLLYSIGCFHPDYKRASR